MVCRRLHQMTRAAGASNASRSARFTRLPLGRGPETATPPHGVPPAAPDDESSPEVVLVLDYVEGPPLLGAAPDGSCEPLPEPLARRAFADVFQVRRNGAPNPEP